MDGYRSQPDPHQAPYSSSYEADYDPRLHYTSSYHQESHFQEPHRPRSRASSIAPPDGAQQSSQQPLHNALNNAFDKSDSARAVDPELIAQITAEVKKSVLDEIKLNGVGVGVAGQPAPPHTYAAQSPTSTTSLPSRNVYTPPTPRHADSSSHGSTSPDPLASDAAFDIVDDTPTPRNDRSAPIDIPQASTKPRPAPTTRMTTDENFSPIEKMWQRLFDVHGQPTPRLGQFLRGLAVHLIDDYDPKKSLVIPPSKMLKFYNDVKLNEEIYPWHVIFGKLPNSMLCKIYREMRCQHHLIQEHNADQPHVPALTPEGFQEWMTAMIQAYPDAEYQRLSKAVLDMPISNADDAKERFPKELPKRLFPQHENLQAQQRCAAALSAVGVGPLRKAPTFPPPPPMGHSARPAQDVERERSPYTSQSDARPVDSDSDGEPLSMPLERERKPYSAAPGGGKVHDDDLSRSAPSEASLPSHRHHAPSSASQSQWASMPNGGPPAHLNHPRTTSQTSGRRPRSPSFSSYGTRSDPSVRDIPGSYYASNMYDSDDDARRFAKDAESRRGEWNGRHADTDAAHRRRNRRGTDSSFDSQSRSVYDDEYYRGRGTNGYDSRGYEARRY